MKSKKAARRVGNSIYKFLRDKLRLPINCEKSGIRCPTTFEILGHGFVPTYRKGEKGKYQFIVKRKAWQTFKQKLKRITKKTLPMSFDERITEMKQLMRGWLNYFKKASIHSKLKKMDEWLRNRLRYCIWHDWKKPDRKRKNLIIMGRAVYSILLYFSFSFNNNCNSFLLGNTVSYLLAKIWLLDFGRVYSTNKSLFSLHKMSPIVLFSSSNFISRS